MNRLFFRAIILLCIIPNIVFSQSTESGDLILDFKNKNVTDSTKVKIGNTYKVRISNINKYLYKVTINGKDTITSTAITAFPKISDGLGGDLIGILDKILSMSTIVNPILTPKLKGNLVDNSFIANDKVEVTNTMRKNGIKRIKKNVKNQKNEDIKNLTEINSKIMVLKKILTIPITYKNDLQEIIFDLQYNDLLKYNSSISKISSKSNIEILELINVLNLKLKTIRNTLNMDQNDLVELTIQHSRLFKENEILKNNFTALNNAYQVANLLIDTISARLNESLAIMQNNIIKSTLNEGDEITTLPIQIMDDASIVTIKIEPINNTIGLQSYAMTYRLTPKTQVYFGTGGGFYVCGFKDDAYSIKQKDSSTFNLFDEDNSAGEVGLTSMIHVGFKVKKYQSIGYHFTFGPGMSLTKTVRPRIVYGLGVGLGRKQMLSVNIIGITGYTNVLSKGYNSIDNYVAKPENPLVSKLTTSIGCSIGLIYKL